jgi:hypothetical protein
MLGNIPLDPVNENKTGGLSREAAWLPQSNECLKEKPRP